MLGFAKNDVTLTWNFFKMTLRDKYLGSGLGMFWAIANPLIMMGIYTFVFAFVFKSRLPGASTTLSYTAWLISGYGPWLATTEALVVSSLSVVSSAGLVKNMAFKTEILPISYALTAIVPLVVSLVFLAVLLFVAKNTLTWHAIFLIPVVFLQFFFIIALGFYLSAVTVFVRDVAIVLPNILMMLLFVTPIFYPIDSMPHIIKVISYFNPFYILAEGYRAPLIQHTIPPLGGLLYVAVLSVILAYFGLRLFRRVKSYFPGLL